MRFISFFSKFTIICNIAFLLFIIFGYMEASSTSLPESNDAVAAIPFIKNLIITLGFSAIIINALMCITYGILWVFHKHDKLEKWLVLVNLVFLILQIYYFFF